MEMMHDCVGNLVAYGVEYLFVRAALKVRLRDSDDAT
jgi:hypothetical protein